MLNLGEHPRSYNGNKPVRKLVLQTTIKLDGSPHSTVCCHGAGHGEDHRESSLDPSPSRLAAQNAGGRHSFQFYGALRSVVNMY